eukprot:TRINITY_DN2057_c0_g1_i14.p1 TRINITY_DN2057_c0_g1~~TRINITY_DN2057_c0_g1_i14.p1  ORF type:complete len:220 (+),score=64.90 TRINITY_DN2057_c0_g1_i14:78-737(+)
MEKRYTDEGNEYLRRGDAELNPGFFKKWTTSRSELRENAKGMYEKAANHFKLAKNFALASEACLKVADCESDEGVAASHYVEAANCMKKINTSEAVQIMERAIQCYCTTGSIRMGARYAKQVAEWYEADYEYELAIEYYLKASELQNIEASDSFGLQCSIKAADLMVLSKEEKYVEAIKKYEEAAKQYLKNTLLKGTAKDLIMKELLLYLAIEVVQEPR